MSRRFYQSGSLRKGLLLKCSFLRWTKFLRAFSSMQFEIWLQEISSYFRNPNCEIPLSEVSLLFLRLSTQIQLQRKGEIQSISVIALFQRLMHLRLMLNSSFRKVEMGSSFFLRINFGQNELIILQVQNRMANPQKYYHNDYKKLMGVDESRTASEKLLDRAIGGVRPAAKPKEEQPPMKKVKEEQSNLTHSQILGKVMKNVSSNNSAGKLLKPLSLLKKCLNDPMFVEDSEINNISGWSNMFLSLMEIDGRMLGSYGEINLVNQVLLEICLLLLVCFKKNEKIPNSEVKAQGSEQNQQQIKKEVGKQLSVKYFINICEMQILYYKLFTDDSFVFNKTLLELKKIFFGYCQEKLVQSERSKINEELFKYLSELLMKLFNLPYTKHQWVKNSLFQYFKEFNFTYKQLFSEDFLQVYLQKYNYFLNYKISRGTGQQVNVFGNGGKGGKVTQLEVAQDDGYDKWATKQ